MLHGRHALWLQGQEEFCLHWPVLLTRVVFQSVALTSLTVDYSGYGCVGPCSNESNFLQVTESFSACLVDIYLASCRKGNSGLNLPRSHEHVLFMLKSSESVRNVRMRLQSFAMHLEGFASHHQGLGAAHRPSRGHVELQKPEKDGKGWTRY